ncbi:MAG: twin-arginine translocase subunit TatC [Nitrospirae bacterium]|nr:MAG: twin-arginine translocase subunit TatC [Nitrospirota bacterium]
MAGGRFEKFFKGVQDRVFAPLEDPKMPLMQHLEEFRVRLTRAVIVLAIVFALCFYFSVQIMDIVRVPLQNAFVFVKFSDQYTLDGIIKHRSLGELMAWLSSGQLVMKWEPTALQKLPFVFLAPAEAIWNNVKVSMVFAAFLVMPYLLFEVWMFSSPGLHAHERRFILPFVIISSVAFYVGLAFCYFIVLPFALNFLVTYGIDSGFIPQLSIAAFVGFNLWFLLIFGLMFELPLAITLLARLGWVNAVTLRQYWKWALVGSFVIAAVLTPTPDPFNQSIMAIPMYTFYELGIIGARWFGKKKENVASEQATTTASAAAGHP